MTSITNIQKNQRKYSQNRLANSSDLSRVSFTVSLSAERLSPLERQWFSFFVAVAKLGFSGICTSIGFLTESEFSANHRTRSERSTYRALAGLENKGFIHRKKCRLGADKFQTTIHFDPDSFAFYLQKRSKNVSPLPAISHIDTHLPSWQEDKYTNNSHDLTPNLISYKLKSKKYTKKTDEYLHPILYTLFCVLTGAALKIAIPRTRRELDTGTNESGIDWAYWSERWTSLPIEHREETARRDFIPSLISPQYGSNRMKKENVEVLVNAFLEKKESPPEPPRDQQISAETRSALDELLSQGFPLAEAEILLAANEKAKARARCLAGSS